MLIDIWGDSIAKGVIYDGARGRYAICPDSCAHLLSRTETVRNHSVMGQTSADGLARLQSAQIEPGWTIAIEYGGNDCDLNWREAAEHPNVPQQGRVPIDRFGENLLEIVALVRERGARPVLVCPPPILSERYFRWVSRGLDPEGIRTYLGDVEEIFRWQAGYADRVRAVAETVGVPLIDIRSCFLASSDLGALMCEDGIHPNAAGQRLIYETIAPRIQK